MLQTRNEKLEKDRADYKTQCDKLENRVGLTLSAILVEAQLIA